MLTPDPEVAFAHPLDLQRWLLSHFESYRFDVDPSVHEDGALIESVRAITQQQQEAAAMLLREQPWDLGTVVFTGPDRLQHFLWAHHEPSHPLHQADRARLFGDALLEHYRLLDKGMAEILDSLPAETLVLVMSDHGFNGCARRFYVNRWLLAQGYLVLRQAKTWRLQLAVKTSHLGSVGWLRRLKRALMPARWGPTTFRLSMFAQAVDWSRTRAYFGPDGGLRINLLGREPKGIVNPEELEGLCQGLRQSLLGLTDPDTGQPVLSSVFSQDELYDGPFTDRAPDLILEPQRDNPDPSHNFVLDGSLEHAIASPFSSSAPYTANHTLDGILIAWGAGVAAGQQITGAQIIDLAPTLLGVLGVPIPIEMDGQVLAELFVPGFLPELRRSAASEPSVADTPQKSYSLDEEIAIEDRLRGLGYLD
jgi:predicted AlkP superfamily phosphohydrolase/phosphomutase